MSLMSDAIGILLAGGQGERLWPLTRDRAKPAVPFGGVYRIIDVTLSNCINSDLRRVFVLTQYKALSLNRHVRQGWSVADGAGRIHRDSRAADARFHELVSGHRRRRLSEHLLDRQRTLRLRHHPFRRPHLQDGLRKMLQQHVDAGADVTVATIEMDAAEAAGRFGVIETDCDWRVLGFEEKPAEPKPSRLHPDKVNASMGVYIFNTQLLIPILIADAENPASTHDFGRDILPRILSKYRVFAYNFEDENRNGPLYWRDVGTVDAYYEANMDLVSVSPIFNLYDKSWPLRTWQQQYPPAKFVFADPDRMGAALDSDRRRRLDHFRRPRETFRAGLRRARQ